MGEAQVKKLAKRTVELSTAFLEDSCWNEVWSSSFIRLKLLQ
jgi:hypothetical protein